MQPALAAEVESSGAKSPFSIGHFLGTLKNRALSVRAHGKPLDIQAFAVSERSRENSAASFQPLPAAPTVSSVLLWV